MVDLTAIRIYIIAPHPFMRAGVHWLIRRAAHVEVIGEASDSLTLLHSSRVMPNVIGAEIAADIERLLTSVPSSKVIAFTANQNSARARRFLSAGGAETKSAAVEELARAA